MLLQTRSVLPLLVILLFAQACASAPPRNPENICSIFKEKRGWHKTAVSAEKKWGSSMHIPMAFMYQESAFQRKARPPRRKLLGFIPWRRLSTAYGYAQAINGTWRSYIDATGEHWRERHDFADATDFIHWYMLQAVKANGISRADANQLYLNYHEGPAGYARGTHNKKPWLIRAATNVQSRADRYAAQYASCEASLQPGFFKRLMGW